MRDEYTQLVNFEFDDEESNNTSTGFVSATSGPSSAQAELNSKFNKFEQSYSDLCKFVNRQIIDILEETEQDAIFFEPDDCIDDLLFDNQRQILTHHEINFWYTYIVGVCQWNEKTFGLIYGSDSLKKKLKPGETFEVFWSGQRSMNKDTSLKSETFMYSTRVMPDKAIFSKKLLETVWKTLGVV